VTILRLVGVKSRFSERTGCSDQLVRVPVRGSVFVAPAGQDKRIHIALCPFRWSSTAYMRLLGPSLSNRLFCTQTLTMYGNLITGSQRTRKAPSRETLHVVQNVCVTHARPPHLEGRRARR
jgi:hypothetical protein